MNGASTGVSLCGAARRRRWCVARFGYPGAESYSVNHQYGIMDEDFKWKNVLCRGDEERLIDCVHEEASGPTLGDGRIAGVSCLEGSSQPL